MGCSSSKILLPCSSVSLRTSFQPRCPSLHLRMERPNDIALFCPFILHELFKVLIHAHFIPLFCSFVFISRSLKTERSMRISTRWPSCSTSMKTRTRTFTQAWAGSNLVPSLHFGLELSQSCCSVSRAVGDTQPQCARQSSTVYCLRRGEPPTCRLYGNVLYVFSIKASKCTFKR